MSSKKRTDGDPPKRKTPARKRASQRRQAETQVGRIEETASTESQPAGLAEAAADRFASFPEPSHKEVTGLSGAVTTSVSPLHPLELCTLAIGIGIVCGALIQRRLAFKARRLRSALARKIT